jgi:TPR repeat protein
LEALGLKGQAKNKRGEVTWGSLAEHVIDGVSDDVPRLIGEGARQTPHKVENLTGKSPVIVEAPRVPPEAEKLFRIARKRYLGLGGKVNIEEAARLYAQAARMGHPLAAGCLGVCYAFGEGVKKDAEKAEELARGAADSVKDAARNGDATAQALFGLMHAEGLGVKKDDREAVRWDRRAAAQGDPWGQNNLGWMYANGRGVDKDEKEAVRWYRRAAAQGHALAQFNLGWMYHNGKGVERDLAKAREWYRKAAALGHEWARKTLASIE